MLQNRYGDREFPVRDRWRNVRRTRVLMRQRDARGTALRGLVWVAPAIVMLVVFGSGVLPTVDRASSATAHVAFFVLLGAFVLLTALGLVVGTVLDATVPRREQERYRRLTGDATITERQQQLLALDAQSDFAIGGWNSSLDYAPAWSRMPAEARERHEHAARPFFATMPLLEVRALRAKLDADEHIASGRDLELFVADAFGDAGLSARFRRVLHGPDGERMLTRMASLTGVDQWDLRALDEPAGGRPARLLRAADVQRVIAVVRMAYLAEHVDEATAWRLVERAAEPAALYGSWDDYWAGVRIGLAFWSDRLDVLQQFDDALAGLRASTWPATRVAFPAGAVPAWLPALAAAGSRSQEGAE